MFERYAVFFTPTGPLAQFGAAWLGWDSALGKAVPHPDIPGLDVAAVTETPRKYGLHGTLKAPFHLAPGARAPELAQALAEFAGRHGPVDLAGLALGQDHGFVALRPVGEATALGRLAESIVRDLDRFRAPLSPEDIARRRRAPLTPRQDKQMLDWGYPYVFQDFHFHLTLSGALPANQGAAVIAALAPRLAPLAHRPYCIDAISLMGQDSAGLFHLIHRYVLTG